MGYPSLIDSVFMTLDQMTFGLHSYLGPSVRLFPPAQDPGRGSTFGKSPLTSPPEECNLDRKSDLPCYVSNVSD